LLATSTASFIFCLYGEELECLIFHLAQSSIIILPLKFWQSHLTNLAGEEDE